MRISDLIILTGFLFVLPVLNVETTQSQQRSGAQQGYAVKTQKPWSFENKLLENIFLTSRSMVSRTAGFPLMKDRVKESLREADSNPSGNVTLGVGLAVGNPADTRSEDVGSIGQDGRPRVSLVRLADLGSEDLMSTADFGPGALLPWRGIGGLFARQDPAPSQSEGQLQSISLFQLTIVSDPSDATVYIDGREVGKGRVSRRLPAGQHTWRVIREPDYEPQEEFIQLNRDWRVKVTLKRIRSPSKKWVWAVVGGVVAAVGAVIIIPPPNDNGNGPDDLSDRPPDPPR